MAEQSLLKRVLDDLDIIPANVKAAFDAHSAFCHATAAQRKDTVDVSELIRLQTAIANVMEEKIRDLPGETANRAAEHKRELWLIGVKVAILFNSSISGMRAAVSSICYLLEQLAGNPPSYERHQEAMVASMTSRASLLDPPTVKSRRRQKENREKR